MEYAPVGGPKLPGYAILEEDDHGGSIEFLDDAGQLYSGVHVKARTIDDAKARAADVCREKIAATSDGPTDLHHWWPIPLETSNAVEYALGHAKRHRDGRE